MDSIERLIQNRVPFQTTPPKKRQNLEFGFVCKTQRETERPIFHFSMGN